jgi:hypothetical protein
MGFIVAFTYKKLMIFYVRKLSNNINDIFLVGDKSTTLFNCLSYLLKALNTNESSNKFEKLWKAFNAIYSQELVHLKPIKQF